MPRLTERRRRPSEVSHILFREESGWNAAEARRWLDLHDFERYGDVEHMDSEGGSKLAPGSYLVYRVSSPRKQYTSFGYGDEVENGIWFKFGGYRRQRAAREDHVAGDWRGLVEPSDGVFIFQADLWCHDDGVLIRQELRAEGRGPEDEEDEYSYDSDEFPKEVSEEGESDSPSHCAAGADCVNAIELPSGGRIGQWLGTELTWDGVDYVCSAVTGDMDSVEAHSRQVGRLWRYLYSDAIEDCLSELHPIPSVGPAESPAGVIAAVADSEDMNVVAQGLWTDGDYIYAVLVERVDDGDVVLRAYEAQPDGSYDNGNDVVRMPLKKFRDDYAEYSTDVKSAIIALLEDAGWR